MSAGNVWQRIAIMGGALVCYMGDDGPALMAPLTCEDGTPATRDYRGLASQTGARLIVGDPYLDTTLAEYTVGDIDPQSREYRAGWLHARAQKRERLGAKWSPAFVDGWRCAWSERTG